MDRVFVLVGLVVGTLGLAFAFHRPGILLGFLGWVALETVWRYRASLPSKRRLLFHLLKDRNPFPRLQTHYLEWTSSSALLLEEEIAELKNQPNLPNDKRRELERFAEIIELRKLLTLPQSLAKRKLRQLFVLNRTFKKNPDTVFLETISMQDLMESATLIAHLYLRIGDTAENPLSYYRFAAQSLLEQTFAKPYTEIVLGQWIERVSDQMQQNAGVSFFLLNLIKEGDLAHARVIAQRLLQEQWDLDEDLRSSLYWLCELLWFSREMGAPMKDYETSMRYLYHICFTAPERAHFLEVDSQYFSQFEVVNELAREAFLFKENLIHRFLELWASGEGIFDSSYRDILEVMTQLKSKIYEDRLTWEKVWSREKEFFSKDYLYAVEGNLSYAKGAFDDAKGYYEKALKVNPNLRSALLNSVFAYAKAGEKELHGWMVDRILNRPELFPAHLYVAANSCLLVGQEKKSEEYYEVLAEVPGWAAKVNLYRSTFCFENGLYEKALLFARLAERDSASDSSVLYHLSLCYSAVGEKERALEIVKKLDHRPHWLDYYRFTLERDAGKEADAIETLLTMPANYFEDPEELEAALSFAKSQKDLRLLRHLKNRS